MTEDSTGRLSTSPNSSTRWTSNQHTKSVTHHPLCQMAWRHYFCTKQPPHPSPWVLVNLNISYCFRSEESDGSPRVPFHVWGGCVEQIRSEFSCSNQNPAAQHSNVIWTAGLCTTTLSDIRATAVPILLFNVGHRPSISIFCRFIKFENEMYKCIISSTLIDWCRDGRKISCSLLISVLVYT